MSISIAIFMEAFVSIHMSMFVLKPLSEMIAKENSNQLFWTLFGIRAGILLFCDLFVTPFIAILDFFMVFIGAFIVVPVFALVTRTPINHKSNQVLNKIESNTNTNTSDNANNPQENIVLKCTECGAILKVEDKFCPSCGAPFDGNNVQVTEKTPILQDTSPIVTYDSTYYVRERMILKNTKLYEEMSNFIYNDLYDIFDGKLEYAYRFEAIPNGNPTTEEDYNKAWNKINSIIDKYV